MVKRKTGKTSPQSLQTNYEQIKPHADRFSMALCEQFEHLLRVHNITLGVPMERRIKSWDSIFEKIDRRELSLSDVIELDDLIGLRFILLFKRDLANIHNIIINNFNVIHYEDTSTRLAETQFGYQSVHYVISLPSSWLKIPSFSDFSNP